MSTPGTIRRLRLALHAAVLAALVLPPATGRAQQEIPAEPALPAYRVELIVFEQLSPASSGEDRTTRDLPPPPTGEPPPESSPGQPAAETPVPVPGPVVPEPLFFRPVATGELADLHGKLARSARYRPLAWVAWEQPGYPRERARAIDFARLLQLARVTGEDAAATPAPEGSVEAGLGGEVTLWLSRYLHLGLDLSRDADDAPARLEQRQRMRSRTLHYFDGPRLGAIAVILPVEEPPSPTRAAQSGSSAGS